MTGYTFRGAVNKGTYVLSECGIDSPRHDAREIALHVCGVEKPWQAPQHLTDQQWERYLTLIGKRASHVPLQQVTGWMYFRHLKLACRPGVFIVRPETEWVAQAGIDALKESLAVAREISPGKSPSPLIIDLCSGSGAIALAVATEVPGTQVVGIEKSDKAIELAKHNAQLVGARQVEFIQADIFEDEWWGSWSGKADLVISNPPYVPPGQVTQLEALQDPAEALYSGGEDGLEAPFRILELSKKLVRLGGTVVIEHAQSQAEAMREKARELEFTNIETGTDLTGRPRYLQAKIY